MVTCVHIIRSCYQDSVILMRIASRVKALPGVDEAALFMGTPTNHAILQTAGLHHPDGADAGPEDILLSVRALNAVQGEAALKQAQKFLNEAVVPGDPQSHKPRTLEAALRIAPLANLVFISLPGAYAAAEAHKALLQGRNVFLFSDNVSLEQEKRLKTEAVTRDLLCMGPDCGTAWINGAGIGFANVVPQGRIGMVGSSGTGMQAVACHLAKLGEGLSQAIGVGGRDMSSDVGGLMTRSALCRLNADADTVLIIWITKSLAPELMVDFDTLIATFAKPVVLCTPGKNVALPHVHSASTLDETALRAVTLLGKTVCGDDLCFPYEDQTTNEGQINNECHAKPAHATHLSGEVVGLYTGGTLAGEAHHVLEHELGVCLPYGQLEALGNRSCIMDLGDDAFTIGRPHPMIDPTLRNQWLTQEHPCLCRGGVLTVLLFDVVLGQGSHADPATDLAAALRAAKVRAKALGGDFMAFGSLIGTAQDPQDRSRQARILHAAGARLFSSNAQAARATASILRQTSVMP